MKTIKQLILLGGAAMMLAACAKEVLEQENVHGTPGSEVREVVLNVTMPDSDTKTTLGTKTGNNYPVYWTKGDVVSLGGVLSEEVTDEEAGTSHATLLVKTNAAAPYNVLYPGVEGVTDKVTFPSNQQYTAGNIQTNTLPMYATANTLNAAFDMQYLGAVLRIPVKFNQKTTVKSLVLSAVGGEGLSGQFSVGTNAQGAFNGELSAFAATTTVTLDVNATFAANSTGVFMIAVPKGTYSKGMALKLYDNEGNYMKASLFSESNTVDAGKVYEFATRAYTQDGTVFFISSVADMQNFAENKGGKQFALLEAQLTADINMSGQTYNATGFKFYGTLDGAGHTISGLTKPLFSNLYGTVRNLTVSANITEAVPSGANIYGLGILARYAYVAGGEEEEGDYGQVIENVVTKGSIAISCEPANDFTVGGMLGANKGIPMNSCENQASVKINDMTPSVSGTFRVGGLTGSAISPSANISGCSNTGAVTVEKATMLDASSIFTVGGLVGYDTQANKVENSTNSGAVTVNALSASDGTPYLMLGGVVGNATAAGFTLTNCDNLESGVVTLGADVAAQSCRVGGVIGRVGGANTIVTDCDNAATVEVKEASSISGSNTFGGIIGVILGSEATVANCKNTGVVKNASRKMECIAGIVGSFDRKGTFTSCENSGDVISNSTPGNPQYLGGAIGKKNADAAYPIEVTSCKNSGTVTINGGEHETNVFMGGIIAGCPGTSSNFTNCENSGAITNNTPKSTANPHEGSATSFTPASTIGGIIGRVTDNGLGQVTNCVNTGDLNNNCAATEVRMGGIIGYSHQGIAGIGGCVNKGLVANNAVADLCYIQLGGIIGYSNASMAMPSRNINEGKIRHGATESTDITGLLDGAYDRSVRLGGVIGMYEYASQRSFTDQENKGEVVFDGTETVGWLNMAGILGRMDSRTYIQNSTNSGYIHSEGVVGGASNAEINIGGIVGRSYNEGSNQTRVTECTNSGKVAHNGTTDILRLGGIIGMVNVSTMTTGNINSGVVENAGEVTTQFRMGGIIGHVNNKWVDVSNSVNKGDVVHSGRSDATVCMAGVVGLITSNQSSTITAENEGAVYTTSSAICSKDLEIAGIISEVPAAMNNCINRGPISVGCNVAGALYISGICAYNYSYKAMSNCTNDVTGTITVPGGITISKDIYCGGVLGGENTKTITHHDLINKAEIKFGSSKENRIITTTDYAKSKYSCIGGCVGGYDNSKNKVTYTNLENYGNVSYYGDHIVEMGGCVGYAAKLAGTLRNEGNLKYQKQPTKSGNSYLGGIVGWLHESTSLENAVCIANIDSYDCAARARTAGIAAGISKNVTVIRGCKYKGDLRGTGSGASAGLMCTVGGTDFTVSFEDCVVGTGTRWYNNQTGSNAYGKVSDLVLNYSDVNSSTTAMLCGSGTTDTNGATTGTMTNCTIGSIE